MLDLARSQYSISIKRRRLITAIIIALGACIALFSTIFILLKSEITQATGSRSSILSAWSENDFDKVYNDSKAIMSKQPLSTFYLVMHGFSAYQLATAQINAQDTLKYIDEAIISLRRALLTKTSSIDSRIHYVLGKAYFHKGAYYADLAVRHLEYARDKNYEAVDIHEYLGLSYALLEDYRSSVAAFSLSLAQNSSDLLLLSIAKSYKALEEYDHAISYLIRCIEQTNIVTTRVKARLALGKIYFVKELYDDAKDIFLLVLTEDEQNADAVFYIGELFAISGDTVKARAEWRKALRLDPSHALARNRLST